jgi:hypothetical protein
LGTGGGIQRKAFHQRRPAGRASPAPARAQRDARGRATRTPCGPAACSPGHRLRRPGVEGAPPGQGRGPPYAMDQGPPPLAMPGPGPRGPASQHIWERRRRGRWDGGKEGYSCRRRTGQRGRPYVPAAPVCAEAHHAGTGPGPHGVEGGPGRANTFPSGPAEPRPVDDSAWRRSFPSGPAELRLEGPAWTSGAARRRAVTSLPRARAFDPWGFPGRRLG